MNSGFPFQVKGIPQNINCVELDHMLSAFNLQENYHTLSGSVSGGVRRKLSIVLALLGGSKVFKRQRKGNMWAQSGRWSQDSVGVSAAIWKARLSKTCKLIWIWKETWQCRKKGVVYIFITAGIKWCLGLLLFSQVHIYTLVVILCLSSSVLPSNSKVAQY